MKKNYIFTVILISTVFNLKALADTPHHKKAPIKELSPWIASGLNSPRNDENMKNSIIAKERSDRRNSGKSPSSHGLCHHCPPRPMIVSQTSYPGISLLDLYTCPTDKNLRLNLTAYTNRALWLASNGHSTTLQQVDNDSANSRFAISGERDLSPDFTFGWVYMQAILQNSTLQVDVTRRHNKGMLYQTRKLEVYAVSKRLGELFVGRGYMASFNTMNDTDLSGTKATMDGEKIEQVAHAVRFYSSTEHQLSSLTVGDAFISADGLNRRNRIRYNSPYIEGFSLQSSWGKEQNKNLWDVVLRFKKELAGTKVLADVAFDQDNDDKYNQVNGSMGALFPNGISVMVAGAFRDWKVKYAPNANLWFAKLGFQHKYFCMGKTAFAVDYGHYRNFVIDTSQGVNTLRLHHKGNSVGVGVVQFIDRLNTELYLMGRIFTMKVPHSETYKPVSVALLGAKIGF